MLNIDSPADFQYFEDLAELLECEEEIEEKALAELLEEVDKIVLSDLIYNYFEEITDFLPGDAAETYGVMERVKQVLQEGNMLAADNDRENIFYASDLSENFVNMIQNILDTEKSDLILKFKNLDL